MSWNVILFESNRGERFVEEFIQSLDVSTIAKAAHGIDLLEKYGPRLGMPHSKKLTGKIFELRIRGKQEVRILYAFASRNIFLLHAFGKKTQKTPKKEIDIAIRRSTELT